MEDENYNVNDSLSDSNEQDAGKEFQLHRPLLSKNDSKKSAYNNR